MTRRIELILIMALVCLTTGCCHVIHRAGVEPGANASIMYTPVYNSYYNPPANYWESKKRSSWESSDFQANLGYAWPIKNGQRLLVQGLLVSSTGDGSESGLKVHSFDFYWQTKSGESNGGVGFLVGLDPRLYFLWGRDYGQSRIKHGLDGGIGIGVVNLSITPQLMYTIGSDKAQISLYSEFRFFAINRDIFCDEDCSDADNLRSRFSLGIIFSLHSPPGE